MTLVLLLAILLALGLGLFLLKPAQKIAAREVVLIREGLSLRQVAQELESRDIITSKVLFMLWAKALGYGRIIKAGEYELGPDMPPLRIYEKLTRGLVMTHAVTIPEGLTRMQIADILAEKRLAERQSFLSLTQHPDIIARYGIYGQNLEGYLYPDTYQFALSLPPQNLIDVMVRRFLKVVEPYNSAIDQSGMDLNQVVILASIVEKETGQADERPLIASVFLNRLKRGMRLESDPTVIYGLPDFNGNITRKDLQTPTPYNTYLIQGLPPGPISNPGLASIKAVLFPAETKYLFFVSKNDGSHHFSRTFSEHRRAVDFYQRKRGKAPPKTS